MTGSTQPQNAVPAMLRRWRRPLRRAGIAVIVVLLIFYGAGGWYFSSQLGDDAFVVNEATGDDYGVEVVGIDSDTITLSVPTGDEPTLRTVTVTGFEHEAGRLRLGDVVADLTDGSNDIVTRDYRILDGTAPVVGDLGDLDSWLYPDDPSFLFPDAQRITYDTELGAMDAWLVPGEGTRWAIFVHGKGAAPREALRMMEGIGNLPMLAITYRNDDGQPRDPSGYYRYGVTEWHEVESAVEYAIAQGADDVVLVGFSTGAALSLSFMYRSDLADRVVGMVFDAPNIDFGRTVDFGASQRDLPVIGLGVPQSLTTVAKFIGSLRFGVDWSELDYIDDIDAVGIPTLTLHAVGDTTVPVDVSERLADASPEFVVIQKFAGGEHVQAWNVDPARYEAAVRRFLDSL